MRYEDAAKIGTNVEGYVRCTYAKLHDIQNGFLFALQHHDAYDVSDAHINASDYFDGESNAGGGAASDQVTQDIVRNSDLSEFVKDIPVVKAIKPYGAWGEKKMVEVKLTDYCRDLLYRKANGMYLKSQKKYRVVRVYVRDVKWSDGTVLWKQGDRRVMLETYDYNLAHAPQFEELLVSDPDQMIIICSTGVYRTELVKKIIDKGYCYGISTFDAELSEKFDYMNELLNPDATFIVKDVAIDWFPTNLKGAFIEDPETGKLVTIDESLEKAKKRLDMAKAILAAATTFAII